MNGYNLSKDMFQEEYNKPGLVRGTGLSTDSSEAHAQAYIMSSQHTAKNPLSKLVALIGVNMPAQKICIKKARRRPAGSRR
jgi:hypothetical protein